MESERGLQAGYHQPAVDYDVSQDKGQLFFGIKAAIPIVIGFIPVSITFGMVSVQSGISLVNTVLMSGLVFAGASQLMAVNMLMMGAGAVEIVSATFVLNLRHFIMSMSIMNELKHILKFWKTILSFGLTDETFSLLAVRAQETKVNQYYILGLNFTAYLSWVLGTFVGGSLASVIPETISSGMAVAIYAMFIGLLVPAVRANWRLIMIAVTGAVSCLIISKMLSSGWSIIGGTIVGAVIGVFVLEEE